MATRHFKKMKKKKKGGEPGVDYDARLHKANGAHDLKKLLGKIWDHESWDKNGDTPLHSYIRRRDKERFNCMMTFLIHSKCDVNLPNRAGQTALHLACQVGDTTMAKALIAFDAKINGVNNSYYTPLDIVLDNHGGDSDLKELLYQLGGMTSEEMGCGEDSSSDDGGRLSPYTEIDVASKQLGGGQLMTDDLNSGRPTSISVVANGYGRRYNDDVDFDDKSPSPHRTQRVGISPPGGLSSLPEEDDDPVFMTALPHEFVTATETSAEDPLFMTARPDSIQDPLFMTAREFPAELEDSGENHRPSALSHEPSVEKEHSKTSFNLSNASSKTVSVHSSLDMHLTCPISPTSSIENALTPLSVQALSGKLHHLIEHRAEDSLSSISSYNDKPPFMMGEHSSAWLLSQRQSSLPLGGTPQDESELDKEMLMAKAYGDIYSYRVAPAANGLADEVDGYSPPHLRPDMYTRRSPQSESPLGHSPTGHSPPTARSPLAHSPKVESPLVQSHSPPARSPRAESPPARSPRAESPPARSPGAESPPARSPRAESPPAQSPGAESPPARSPRAESPPARSPGAESPPAQSPATHSPELHIPKTTGQSSPSCHPDHGKSQHVHFAEQPEKKDSKHLSPLKVKKEGGGRGKEFRRHPHFIRQPSSDGPMRSLSTFNNDVDVLKSIIGESVVPHKARAIGQRILCLDGGGVKGLIQIEILKTIEQMTGKSISELFDWVVGTSTGGILALGMIYGGLSLAELRRLYFEMKDTVFKPQFKFFNHACDTNALEELLKKMLGTEMKMDSVKKPNILITAVDKTTNRLPLVYFSNCLKHVDRKSVRDELVWKVARYTSAAPVFFTECDNYIDGGVVANNPTMHALPEIQEFLAKTHGRDNHNARISCVVSLGCGVYPPEPLGNTDIADALKFTKMHKAPERLGHLLTLLTTALGGSEDIARLCRIMCEQQSISYFRFSPEIGQEVGTTEKDNSKLCEIIIRAKALFVENAEQVKEMVKVLGCEMHEDYLCHV